MFEPQREFGLPSDHLPGSEEQASSTEPPPMGPRPSSYDGPYNNPPGGGRGERGGASQDIGDRPFNSYLDAYIDPVIPLESLPSWDGADDTAVHYILEVREYASMGGYTRAQLGRQLWRRFKKGSPIYNWYMTLTPADKAYMKSDYTCFLSFIWDMWLGDRWLHSQRQKYYKLAFREEGHSTEAPVDFIQRRIILGRMISVLPLDGDGNVDPHGEVLDTLYALPMSWRAKLAHLNIPNMVRFQRVVMDMSEVLLYAYELEKNPPLAVDDQNPASRQLGVEVPVQPAGVPQEPEDDDSHSSIVSSSSIHSVR